MSRVEHGIRDNINFTTWTSQKLSVGFYSSTTCYLEKKQSHASHRWQQTVGGQSPYHTWWFWWWSCGCMSSQHKLAFGLAGWGCWDTPLTSSPQVPTYTRQNCYKETILSPEYGFSSNLPHQPITIRSELLLSAIRIESGAWEFCTGCIGKYQP